MGQQTSDYGAGGSTVTLLVASRILSCLGAPITILLLSQHLSPQEQGYYFTFASMIALRLFVEWGFSVILVQFASHEWAHLRVGQDGKVTGDTPSLLRLASLLRIGLRWYAGVALVFVICIAPIGYVFLSAGSLPFQDWIRPWCVLVLLTGVQLVIQPLMSILEGCNQLRVIYLISLMQSLFPIAALWVGLFWRCGLWVAPISLAVSILCSAVLLGSKSRVFLTSIPRAQDTFKISWGLEVWPLQWKLMLQSVCNYLAFSLFVPVTFRYHGAAEAGRIGLTWSMASALGATAFSWVQASVPSLGVLVARRDFIALDHLFAKVLIKSLAFIATGAAGAWSVVWFLNYLNHPLALRILPPVPTGLFLLAAVMLQVSRCHSAYFRAHKQEPLLGLVLITSVVIGALVRILGPAYGALGMATAYLAVVSIWMVPYGTWVWFMRKAEWHKPTPSL